MSAITLQLFTPALPHCSKDLQVARQSAYAAQNGLLVAQVICENGVCYKTWFGIQKRRLCYLFYACAISQFSVAPRLQSLLRKVLIELLFDLRKHSSIADSLCQMGPDVPLSHFTRPPLCVVIKRNPLCGLATKDIFVDLHPTQLVVELFRVHAGVKRGTNHSGRELVTKVLPCSVRTVAPTPCCRQNNGDFGVRVQQLL